MKQTATTELAVHLRRPHEAQRHFIGCQAKRRIVRAGRRGGKTVGASTIAVQKFLDKQRILYAVPTQEQIEKFWFEVKRALAEPIDAGVLYKNETRHVIEVPGTENRIRAKTAWDADTLRGDYADLLILDEFQMMAEDAWELVGAPMLLDNDGDAVFIYTPPSIRTISRTKARDPRHAAKLFKMAQRDESGRWGAFHFSSHANPHISKAALAEITQDMSSLAYRQEIEAEDTEDNPGALWKREWIEHNRVIQAPELRQLVVGVDPSATSTGDEWGIIAVGTAIGPDGQTHFYVLEDASLQASPDQAARAAATVYHKLEANMVVAEANNGGEMVALTLHTADYDLPVDLVHASRGKQVRAEPISARYEQGRVHHVGTFGLLEDELCMWQPGDTSPNRLDALVWAASYLGDMPTATLAVAELRYGR